MIALGFFTLAALLAGFALWLIVAWSTKRDREWQRKELRWEAERRQLLDRVMFLADRPWETPDTYVAPPAETEDVVFPESMVIDEDEARYYTAIERV